MIAIQPTMAQEIAQAAIAFQRECTGRAPESVTVTLGEETLVVTLHEALSPAEKAMARTPEGAARVHEYHRQLFRSSGTALHQELERILGVEVEESRVEMKPASGRSDDEAFPAGALVQVYHLSHPVGTLTWSTTGKAPSGTDEPSHEEAPVSRNGDGVPVRGQIARAASAA
jgi:uncharacterized protein YbcI